MLKKMVLALHRVVFMMNTKFNQRCVAIGAKLGQALPEYALILAFMALACMATLQAFGVRVDNFFTTFGTQFSGITGG
jgi:Flp pilus assembly pilin Flp